MNRRIVKLLLWVDYNTDGIRLRLFIAAAVVQVFLAPLWDQYLPYHRVAARMEPATLLATLVFLLVAVALCVASAQPGLSKPLQIERRAQRHSIVATISQGAYDASHAS